MLRKKNIKEFDRDDFNMTLALIEAKRAYSRDEVPIGACIFVDDKLVAKGYNDRNTSQNAIRHAEIMAIDRACRKLKSWRLENAVMYVTLQPCPMCMGAIANARIKKVVYGATNPNYDNDICDLIANDKCLNHKIELVGGVKEQECKDLLSNFFAEKREEKKFTAKNNTNNND